MKRKTRKQISQITAILLMLMAAIAFAACSGTDSSENDADIDDTMLAESNEGDEYYEDDEEYDDDFGPDDEVIWIDGDSDEGIGDLIEVQKDGMCGAINKTGEQVIPYEYDYIEYVGPDRYLLSRSDGQEGIVNSNNEEIIAFGKYEFTTGSLNDYAYGDGWINTIAARDCGSGKWGYYSAADNSWVIEPMFKDAAPFDGPVTAVKDQNDRWGFINAEGEYVVQPKYKEVDINSYSGFSYGGDAAKAVAEDGRTVFVLESGEEYYAPEVEDVYEVADYEYGCFLVHRKDKGDTPEGFGVADKKGNIIIPVEYNSDEIYISEDEIAVQKWSQAHEENEWTIYDHNGKKTGRQYSDDEYFEMSTGHPSPSGDFIDYVWMDDDRDVDDMSEDEVAFAGLKNGGSGYRLFNKNGRKLGKAIFDKVYSFYSYPDKVQFCAFEKNGKIGFMDRQGKTVLKPAFPANEDGGLRLNPGFWSKDFGIIPDKKTDKYAVIDKDFNLITDYQFTDFGAVNSGLLAAGDGRDWCVINTKGEEVIPNGKYKKIATIYRNGLILVKDPSSKKYAFFNAKGKQVTEFKFAVGHVYD